MTALEAHETVRREKRERGKGGLVESRGGAGREGGDEGVKGFEVKLVLLAPQIR